VQRLDIETLQVPSVAASTCSLEGLQQLALPGDSAFHAGWLLPQRSSDSTVQLLRHCHTTVQRQWCAGLQGYQMQQGSASTPVQYT
jgi:hypothetical protein